MVRENVRRFFNLTTSPLPPSITARLGLNGLSRPSNLLKVRTARTREDYVSAFRILQQRYEAIGLSRKTSTSMRIMPFHLSSAAQVFVAQAGRNVVGTVTLIQDNFDGLPIASNYPNAIEELREQSLRIGEISSLAVDPNYSAKGEVFAQLTRLLTFFAREQGLEYLTAIVHPRHSKFYQHAMGFQTIGPEKSYAAVQNKPGIAVLGNVNDQLQYRPRYQDYYFEGKFHPRELKPRPMLEQDCQYFDHISRVDSREMLSHRPVFNGLKLSLRTV